MVSPTSSLPPGIWCKHAVSPTSSLAPRHEMQSSPVLMCSASKAPHLSQGRQLCPTDVPFLSSSFNQPLVHHSNLQNVKSKLKDSGRVAGMAGNRAGGWQVWQETEVLGTWVCGKHGRRGEVGPVRQGGEVPRGLSKMEPSACDPTLCPLLARVAPSLQQAISAKLGGRP